jgi:hypothetical protein
VRAIRKVLCSIGTGPHAELLAVSAKTFRIFADIHGYELDLHTEGVPDDRPVSWARIPLIQSLLKRFDLVFWIDADAAIVDASLDIAHQLGRRDVMGMAAHTTPESREPIPNCGVWVIRAHRMSSRLLANAWEHTQYINHKWWENAAVMDELGYELDPEVRLANRTSLYRHTRFLSNEWNSVPIDPAISPRIVHFPGMPLAERLMQLEACVENAEPSGG